MPDQRGFPYPKFHISRDEYEVSVRKPQLIIVLRRRLRLYAYAVEVQLHLVTVLTFRLHDVPAAKCRRQERQESERKKHH